MVGLWKNDENSELICEFHEHGLIQVVHPLTKTVEVFENLVAHIEDPMLVVAAARVQATPARNIGFH